LHFFRLLERLHVRVGKGKLDAVGHDRVGNGRAAHLRVARDEARDRRRAVRQLGKAGIRLVFNEGSPAGRIQARHARQRPVWPGRTLGDLETTWIW
jgi:hypothetical protein